MTELPPMGTKVRFKSGHYTVNGEVVSGYVGDRGWRMVVRVPIPGADPRDDDLYTVDLERLEVA